MVLPAPLEGWDNFYVIIGSSAAALTGLQFVVIALMADVRVRRDAAAVEAFATPTVIHFGAVLLIASFITIPRHTIASLQWCLFIAAAVGLLYTIWVIIKAIRQEAYTPELEDWIFHAILPVTAYSVLVIASIFLVRSPENSLFVTSGSALLLMFIGIHNAWDAAVWMMMGAAKPSEEEQKIREVIGRWHQATKSGDLNSVLELMTDDVVFLTAGRPPMTKKDFASAFRAVSGEVNQEIKEIYVRGDIAYGWSHIAVTMDGKTRSGHTLTVFRKREDGSWVLARDANLIT